MDIREVGIAQSFYYNGAIYTKTAEDIAISWSRGTKIRFERDFLVKVYFAQTTIGKLKAGEMFLGDSQNVCISLGKSKYRVLDTLNEYTYQTDCNVWQVKKF